MKIKTQLDLLRMVSPIKRLEAAFRLSALTRELALTNIKSQNPNAGKEELIKLLSERYAGR